MSWLLLTVLRWTMGYTCLFPFWFPQCVCPAVGLLVIFFNAVHRLLIQVASPYFRAGTLGCLGFSSCGAMDQLPHRMWDLPGPRIELALQGRFLTTGPPVCCSLTCVWLCAPWMIPSRLLCPWDSLGKNTGVEKGHQGSPLINILTWLLVSPLLLTFWLSYT